LKRRSIPFTLLCTAFFAAFAQNPGSPPLLGRKPNAEIAFRGSFPNLPPIADADPLVRHKVVLCLPHKLRLTRADTTLAIKFDMASLQKVSVTAGKNMVMGIKDEMRVYPVGSLRPERAGDIDLSSNFDFCTTGRGSTQNLNRNEGAIPERGKKYVVEVQVTVFETDIPGQHFWQPQGSPKYRKLLSITIKSVD
jgi:hypothetical protein